MADTIRVLIVDDIPETRDHLSELLGCEDDIEVVGAAASGDEQLSCHAPRSAVVMMSVRARSTAKKSLFAWR